jgi:uncharacterized protein (TIRG00374 family)
VPVQNLIKVYSLNKIRQLALGLIIAFSALYYTIRNVSVNEVLASFAAIDYVYLIPSLLIILSSYVVHAFRWQILLLPLAKIPVAQLFSPIMVGAMGNILPGRPGEILRAWLLGKKLDLPVSGILASILIERLFDLVILLLLFTWILLFHAEVFSAQIQYSGLSVEAMAKGFGQVTGGLLLVLGIFIYCTVFHKDVLKKFIGKRMGKWQGKTELMIDNFSLGLQSIRNPMSLLKVTGYSILENAANIFAFYPLYWAYNLQDKSLTSLLILMVVVTIIIVALPTPAFLGSFNAGVLIALHEMGNESEVVAVGFGMVSWTLNFVVIFIAGLFFILRDQLTFGQLLKAGDQAK